MVTVDARPAWPPAAFTIISAAASIATAPTHDWLVPHFEKMLYDNALLAACYLEACQATERDDYRRVVRETLDYVLRDMTDPAGGFLQPRTPTAKAKKASFTSGRPSEVQARFWGAPAGSAFAKVYDVTDAAISKDTTSCISPSRSPSARKMLDRDLAELEAELAEAREAARVRRAARAARPR